MKRKIMNFWNKIKKLGIWNSLKVIAESWKPRNYQFVQWVIFYALFVVGGGLVLIGSHMFKEWGFTLLDCLIEVSIFAFSTVAIFVFVGILLKKKEIVLSSTIQWWIFIMIEGVIFDGIFLDSNNKLLFIQINFDNSIQLSYIWISLIPILFAGIHIGCKVGYGYRPNEMPRELYQKWQSFFKGIIELSFFVSIMLSIGKPQMAGSVAYINYLISFFIIMVLNKCILTQFYRPIEVSKENE